MAFTLPQFINNLDFWVDPHTPAGGPPDFTNQPCQIYTYSKAPFFWFDSTSGKWFPIIIIRVPDAPAFDYRPGGIFGKDLAFPNDDLLFLSLWRVRMHVGFPNVYKQHYCVQCTRAGAPVVQPRP